jgi:hypothetical protein
MRLLGFWKPCLTHLLLNLFKLEDSFLWLAFLGPQRVEPPHAHAH